MCKETGWTVEYVLQMPVRRFFVLRKSLLEIKREDKYSHLLELCDIQMIGSAQGEYYQELKDFYRSQIQPDVIKKRLNSRTFNSDNEEESQKAADILSATFKQKARLMGLATDG